MIEPRIPNEQDWKGYWRVHEWFDHHHKPMPRQIVVIGEMTLRLVFREGLPHYFLATSCAVDKQKTLAFLHSQHEAHGGRAGDIEYPELSEGWETALATEKARIAEAQRATPAKPE